MYAEANGGRIKLQVVHFSQRRDGMERSSPVTIEQVAWKFWRTEELSADSEMQWGVTIFKGCDL